jgi:hypothetical protein
MPKDHGCLLIYDPFLEPPGGKTTNISARAIALSSSASFASETFAELVAKALS